MKIKGLIVYVVAAALVYGYAQDWEFRIPATDAPTAETAGNLQQAFELRLSDVQVEGQGTVVRTLRDDLEGSRHQKMILRVAGGQTVLISHNIDLAPRVRDVKKGDTIEFYGEYEWNSQGGVIHWTHHDPAQQHVGGWLKHNGQTYQ